MLSTNDHQLALQSIMLNCTTGANRGWQVTDCGLLEGGMWGSWIGETLAQTLALTQAM